jgi:hypothetical protein
VSLNFLISKYGKATNHKNNIKFSIKEFPYIRKYSKVLVAGFKSRRPHQLTFLSVESRLFTELHVENCVIKCFKWFSKVLLRLMPSSLDFSTNSLSRYNTTLPLVPIAFASVRMRGVILYYMFGPSRRQYFLIYGINHKA